MIVALSLSVRVVVNAEALNMAEAVGNYTRHRKAPIVVATDEGYSVVYVPAVSGESLAHGYQLLLAQLAKERKLPVTKMDELGYFLKFSDDNVLRWYEEDLKKIGYTVDKFKNASVAEIEKKILTLSTVADVGGFLYTTKQVKRTSAIRFSYMLPALDAIEKGGVALTPQLHTRYAPPELTEAQKLFYLESGSALYTFTAELIASDISRLYYSEEEDPELKRQRVERVKVAVDTLSALVDGMLFGARRSRYQPLWNIRSIVVALSKGPVEFIVSPGLTRDYIKKTYERAVALTKALQEETINIYVYNGENLEEPIITSETMNVTYEKVTSHTDALIKARDKLVKIIEALQLI
ncbi:MAG: type I-A CRISPR-associated protein Cas7/Csa2 [Desulfurococcaceae archaeon]|jgi:CRISPR-associated protein Csa2|nr:type I-A CRISPR-associated protein Cas7/Csa2 [Desulfurococcaceae archaeon]